MNPKNRVALSQPALNQVAKLPGGPAELRKKREQAIKLRAHAVEEHRKQLADVDGLIERIGIALGEVDV